jgi:dolichol kinase
VISLALLVGYSLVTEAYLPLAFLVLLAAGTSLIENLGVLGLDNIMVPLLIAYMLSL